MKGSVAGSTFIRYEVWGEGIATATAMLCVAPEGEVVLSQSTLDLLRDRVAVCTPRVLFGYACAVLPLGVAAIHADAPCRRVRLLRRGSGSRALGILYDSSDELAKTPRGCLGAPRALWE